MKWRHISAVAWMRWRMLINQISRQSLVNRVFSCLVLVVAILSSALTFVSTLALASWILPSNVPSWLVFSVDGFVVVFLFAWFWGVVIELQQSEILSIDKFLHLPVSPRAVLALNYLSSLLSLNLVVFVPSSLAIALVFAMRYGGWLVLAPFLLIAFYFLVTTITWQLRGWLAMLMADKRRRRSLMAIGSVVIISIALLPQLLLRKFDTGRNEKSGSTASLKMEELERQRQAGELVDDEFEKEKQILQELKQQERKAKFEAYGEWARLANKAVPFGWLPQGIDSAGAGQGWVAILCLLGMATLGGLSLARATQTSLGLYTGSNQQRGAIKLSETEIRPELAGSAAWKPNWIEWNWPFLNAQQSAVAMGTVRSLARAPEAKLALIWPVLVMLFLGGSSAAGKGWDLPVEYRSMMAAGICFFIMMGATQLIQNQFGFERDGFRFNLLAPIPEKDLLIGKNAALAPLALVLGLVALAIVQVFTPMFISHFVATFFQLGTMLIISCLVGNLISVMTPLGVKPGSMKAVNMKLGIVALQMAIFFLAPLAMTPALAPLFAEIWLNNVEGWQNIPVYLLSSAGYFAVMIIVYRIAIGWEADLLYHRRHRILETVTSLEG